MQNCRSYEQKTERVFGDILCGRRVRLASELRRLTHHFQLGFHERILKQVSDPKSARVMMFFVIANFRPFLTKVVPKFSQKVRSVFRSYLRQFCIKMHQNRNA